MTEFELEALEYAERYGIIEYTLNGEVMEWIESYPTEGSYMHTKNLVTGESKGEKII